MSIDEIASFTNNLKKIKNTWASIETKVTLTCRLLKLIPKSKLSQLNEPRNSEKHQLIRLACWRIETPNYYSKLKP